MAPDTDGERPEHHVPKKTPPPPPPPHLPPLPPVCAIQWPPAPYARGALAMRATHP